MDLLTKADLSRLARTDNAGVHVSLFLPTHRFGTGIEQDRLRWKNLLVETEDALRIEGIRTPEIRELLMPAWRLHDDALFWKHQSDGLAYFANPVWHQPFRVPIELPEVGAVGERFVVGPLLRLLAGDSRFLLLTLSQNQVRLLEGSKYRVEEVRLHGVPTSLEQVLETTAVRTEAMARPTHSQGAYGGSQAVFYGFGGYDEDLKKDQVEQFLRDVSTGLQEYLRHERIPMVLAGVNYVTTMFRGISPYPYILDESVDGNHDRTPAEELHVAAWSLAERTMRQAERRDAARFEALHGTGLATDDLQQLLDAAAEGRIETLFLAAEPSCWEDPSREQRVVQLGALAAHSRCESLDHLAIDTLNQAGKVYVVPGPDLPGGGDAAALLRY